MKALLALIILALAGISAQAQQNTPATYDLTGLKPEEVNLIYDAVKSVPRPAPKPYDTMNVDALLTKLSAEVAQTNQNAATAAQAQKDIAAKAEADKAASKVPDEKPEQK